MKPNFIIQIMRTPLKTYRFRLDIVFNTGRSISYLNADFYQKSFRTPKLHRKFALVLFGNHCARCKPTLAILENITALRLAVLDENGFELKSQTYLY